MKTAILYTSRHGTTARVGGMIAQGLGARGEVCLIDLNKERDPDISPYDTVILGTSIHASKPAKAMQRYTTETPHKNILETKTIGLFICCMETDEQTCALQLEHAFPEYLHTRAKASAVAGGEFLCERMNALERMIIKRISGSTSSVSKLKEDAIEKFIVAMT